jgi:hypothetical protein
VFVYAQISCSRPSIHSSDTSLSQFVYHQLITYSSINHTDLYPTHSSCCGLQAPWDAPAAYATEAVECASPHRPYTGQSPSQHASPPPVRMSHHSRVVVVYPVPLEDNQLPPIHHTPRLPQQPRHQHISPAGAPDHPHRSAPVYTCTISGQKPCIGKSTAISTCRTSASARSTVKHRKRRPHTILEVRSNGTRITPSEGGTNPSGTGG